MRNEDIVEKVRQKFERLSEVLDERGRRVWAAVEAEALGYGGQSIVAKATGLSRTTLHRGDLENGPDALNRPPGQNSEKGRRPQETDANGAGIVNGVGKARGTDDACDPENPLRWTCRSTRQLAAALGEQGHPLGHQTVASLLDELGYSLQGNGKTKEGSGHPDRDAQFRYIHGRVEAFQSRGQPVVSVDTKKKELVGDFKNGDGNGIPRVSRSRCASMTSSTRRWEK